MCRKTALSQMLLSYHFFQIINTICLYMIHRSTRRMTVTHGLLKVQIACNDARGIIIAGVASVLSHAKCSETFRHYEVQNSFLVDAVQKYYLNRSRFRKAITSLRLACYALRIGLDWPCDSLVDCTVVVVRRPLAHSLSTHSCLLTRL